MKKIKLLSGTFIAFSIIFLPGIRHSVFAQTDKIVVIVSKHSQIDSIPLVTLQNIFKGKIQTYRGIKIIPINFPPNSEVSNLFHTFFLNSSDREMERYWQKFVLQGKGRPPRTLPNANVIKRAVSRVNRAISYIPVSALDDSVKKVTIY